MSEFKKCVIGGYTPYKAPCFPSRIVWHNTYKLYLQEMYKIIANILNSRYKINNINWESDDVYSDFCTLVYESSSKHVSKFV